MTGGTAEPDPSRMTGGTAEPDPSRMTGGTAEPDPSRVAGAAVVPASGDAARRGPGGDAVAVPSGRAARAFPRVAPAVAERWRAAGLWPGRLLDTYLDDAAARFPTRTAVVDASLRGDHGNARGTGERIRPDARVLPTSARSVDHRVSYRELADVVARVAGGLRSLGVRRGDVVSLQLPNWWEALAAHLAVLRIGAVSNPLMPILRERELRFALRDAGSRVLILPATFRGYAHASLGVRLATELPALDRVVSVRGATEGALSFEDLSGDDRDPEPGREPTDPAVLLYTSGTESEPKGAVHCHETLAAEDRSMIDHFGLTGDDVVWMPSPVAHVTGVLYGFHLTTILGTTVVYQDVWDPGRALELIETHRCSVTVAATPFLHGVTHHADLSSRDVSSLRVFACGGADVPPGLVTEAAERLGCLVVRVYGSTEIPTVTAGRATDPSGSRAGTDGRVVGAAELRVVDDDGAVLPPGSDGLLLARGPEAFAGYLGRGSPFDADGWFDTGDRGRVDAHGFLTVTGRSKDIILRGGENLSAKEIEDLLYGHPDVADVAVVAVPDPVMTERACAVVVPRPGTTVDVASLREFLEGLGVARQKYPERVEIVGELPRTPTGKIQKFRLRDAVR